MHVRDTKVWAVLMQQGQSITYMSKALKGRTLSLSTYKNELFAVVTVKEQWRPFLLGQQFVVKIHHKVLKFLLEQKVRIEAH